ncbi:hypothetical protein R6Q59_036273 [Mikania micrantha]
MPQPGFEPKTSHRKVKEETIRLETLVQRVLKVLHGYSYVVEFIKEDNVCKASMQTLTGIKWLFMCLILEAQADARLLMFSHMNLLSPLLEIPFLSAPNQASECLVDSQRNMEVLMAERPTQVFHNKVIDGTTMKRLISRFIDHYGIGYTSHILDQVKTLGFRQATAASISLGIDDLLTIPSKRWLVQDAEQQSFILKKHHHYGNAHAVEKLRQSIEIWYATSEYLRQEMTPNFRMTDKEMREMKKKKIEFFSSISFQIGNKDFPSISLPFPLLMKIGNTTCVIFLSFPSLNITREQKMFLLFFHFIPFLSLNELGSE